jgi:phosphoribosylformylglycinamidine synthase
MAQSDALSLNQAMASCSGRLGTPVRSDDGVANRTTHRLETSVARVVVDVMLKPEILDPQGQAVANALPGLGLDGVTSVRIGKHIEIEFADSSADDAIERAHAIADRLLANPVIEDFTIRADDLEGADR